MKVTTLKRVEIFRTGTHTDSAGNKKAWTLTDLQKMVSLYDPAAHEAPAVVGHPKSDSPAYGWVERVYVDGETLFADLKQVPVEFKDAVEAGRYKKRSIAVYPDGSLRHVGFLGAQPPAIKGLRDVAFASSADAQTYEFSETEADDAASEEEPMSKELLEQLKAAQDETAQTKTALAKAEAERDEALKGKTSAEKQLAEFSERQVKEKREARAQKLIDSGKILPASMADVLQFAEALGCATGHEFADADGNKVSAEEQYWRKLEMQAGHGLFGEFATAGKAQKQESAIDMSGMENRV